MRILLVEGSGRGFLSHYAHALARGLFEAGHEVRLVTARRDELATWKVPFPKKGCLSAGWRGWLCLARDVLTYRPQVVHLQWVDKPLAAQLFTVWARRRGIRVVYTPHNILPHRRRWLTMPAFRALYRCVDRVVARDHHIAWGLEEILGVPRTRLILLPGSPNLMAHPDAPRTALAELPRKRAGEFRLLYFGHGSERKGLAYLLDALSLRTWPRALRLVVAGEGVLAGVEADALARMRSQVRISVIDRYIEPAEVAALFTSADLLVMPYVKLCKSPLTDLAAAFRLPVLRSNRVQAAYFSEGVHGLTVPHGDPIALAIGLARLVDQPALLAPLCQALQRQETLRTAIRRLAAGHERLYEQLWHVPTPEHETIDAPETGLMTPALGNGRR
jgi:glycosyltransferase involved in cell wall biosynthesis